MMPASQPREVASMPPREETPMRPSFFWYSTPCSHPGHRRMAYAGGCGPSEHGRSWGSEARAAFGAFMSEGHDAAFGMGGFGVPRPLRFLAWRLGLDGDQVAEVAKVLERVKLERAQSSVDLQRAS